MERVAKDIRRIVPDLVTLQVVREDGLRLAGVQTVLDARDLERDPAGGPVDTEGLGVVGVGLNRDLGSDGRADRPEVYGCVAVVDDDGVACCVGQRGEGRRGS